MKTLEQTLEELKQIQEHVNANGANLKESDWENITKQLESAYDLASTELDKIEENSKQILQNNEE